MLKGTYSRVVIPAQAGIYVGPHACCLVWIPAFAGMTVRG